LRNGIFIAAFFFIAIVLIIGPDAEAFSKRPPKQNLVPDKVLVKFHEGVGPEAIARIVESEGGTVIKVFASTGVHLIVLEEGVSPVDAVKRFISHQEVEYAEPVVQAEPLE